MDERLFDTVEVCLAALKTGVDLDACLALYPDLADELEPILAASQSARVLGRFPLPDTTAENRSRARFLSTAAAINIKAKPKFSWVALRRAVLVALVVMLAFAISWNGLLVASAKSLPGDVLYPVKRVTERVNLSLTPNVEEKHQYESDFNMRRAEEVKLLLKLGRVEHVSYEGTVTEITPDRWMVGGFTVLVSSDTVLIGSPQIGQFVEVEGQSQPGGWVNAQEIHLRYFQYAGEVEQIEADFWTISGTRLDLSSNTQIDPGLQVHDRALALVQSNDDGKLTALAVMGIPEDVQFNGQGTEIILEGKVEGISDASWVVAGRSVRIDSQTLIAADIGLGDVVRVHALPNWDGSLAATRIELLLTSQLAPVVPGQKFQDPSSDLFNDKGDTFDRSNPGASLDQAEPEEDGQTTVTEDHEETPTQVDSTDDHEDADEHQEGDGDHDDGDHQEDDKPKQDDHHEDNHETETPEVDD